MGNFPMDKKSNCVASVIRTHYWRPYFECISITSELCGGFCLYCSFCDSISEVILKKKWEHWNPALLCVNFNPSIYLWWDLGHVILCSWLPFFIYYARQLDSYIRQCKYHCWYMLWVPWMVTTIVIIDITCFLGHFLCISHHVFCLWLNGNERNISYDYSWWGESCGRL